MTFLRKKTMNPATIEDRIQRGRTAISLALVKGLNTTAWQQQLALLERTLAQAREVASLTLQLLHFQGWCLWQCCRPINEVIVVASNDQVAGMPEGLPIYTQAELEMLANANPATSTLRIICEAKKRRGVRIIGFSQLPPKTENATIVSKDLTHV
jgi:hypothetical protein